MHVRSISADELGAFAALSDDADGVASLVNGLWTDGTGRPDWTLVAEADDGAVGRLALSADAIGGGLTELEFRFTAQWVDWSHPKHEAAATALLEAAVGVAGPHAPTVIERRLNPEMHADIPQWRAVLEANGFSLFQEKEGLVWTDPGGDLPMPWRLSFTSLAKTGREPYADAMAASIPGTLDRNDAYYVNRCGPAAWAREMLGYCGDADEESWLLAHEPDGTLAGYVALGELEPGVATIVHIAVAPERRGRGYVNELLASAHSAARRRGFGVDISDVDTVNAPMIAAMERNGHRPDVRPWHVWAYRRSID